VGGEHHKKLEGCQTHRGFWISMEIVVEEDKEEEPTLASRVGSKWISSEPRRTGVVYVL
jgi:hypothetical protein